MKSSDENPAGGPVLLALLESMAAYSNCEDCRQLQTLVSSGNAVSATFANAMEHLAAHWRSIGSTGGTDD